MVEEPGPAGQDEGADVGRVVVSAALSVDGFAEGPGADLSVMPLDETFNVHNAERIREADTLL